MEKQIGNRTQKFFKNIAGSAFLQIVTIITGFISPRIMLGAFGSEINGITSSITQFISYITLVEAGLSNATIFALYKPLANKDNDARDALICAAKISYYRVGFVFVGLSIVLAVIYPFIGKTNNMSKIELSILVLVLCCNSTINFFVLAKYRTLLTADQCGYIVSFASSMQLIVHLIIITVAVKIGLNVIITRTLGIGALLVTSIILSVSVRYKYGKINYNAPPNMKALDKRWDAMFLQLLGVVATSTPVIVMTYFLDFKLISVFTIYNMIAGSVNSCISVFTSGLSSAFGNIYAIGNKELLKKTTEEFRTAFYILITIIYSVMLVMFIPFIRIYTEGIDDVNYILPTFGFLFVLKGLLDNFKTPHGMFIYSFGKFKIIKRQTMIQAILIVILSVILTKLYGLEGNMIALCIANLYMLIELLWISPKELVEMSRIKNVRQIIQILIIVIGVYWISLKIGINPQNYIEWLIYALITAIISSCITVSVFFIFDNHDVKELCKRLHNINRRPFMKG